MLSLNLRSLTALLFSLLCSVSAFADGAGSSGGGADTFGPSTGSAWFVGEGKRIRVCTAVSSEFGLPNGANEKEMIRKVFENWHRYVDERKVESDRVLELRLVFNLEFLSSCDGSEDLTFYFGNVKNNPAVAQKIETAKKLYNNPTAFAFRQSFDEKSGWGRGFVWVKESDPALSSPSLWQNPFRLQAILMHEIGHILGCDHVAGTVMEASLGEFIVQSSYVVRASAEPTRSEYFANHIDGASQLYSCWSCLTEVSGEIGTPKRFEPKTGFDPRATFKRFTGRQAVGEIKARFHMELNEHDDQHPFKSLRVTYTDGVGSKTLPFLMREGGSGFDQSNDSSAFRVYSSSAKNGGTASVTSAGGVFEGYVRDAENKLRPVTITINSVSNYSWVQINYADGLVDLPLFRAASTPNW